jgi:hypothetical protein
MAVAPLAWLRPRPRFRVGADTSRAAVLVDLIRWGKIGGDGVDISGELRDEPSQVRGSADQAKAR